MNNKEPDPGKVLDRWYQPLRELGDVARVQIMEAMKEYHNLMIDYIKSEYDMEEIVKVKTFTGRIKKLLRNQIFVYDGNLEGKNDTGTSLWAVVNAGAKLGIKEGPNGRAFGILTRDLRSINHPSIPKERIVQSIEKLYNYAKVHPELEFVIPYGDIKSPNGYTAQQIAIMFNKAGRIPDNLIFREEFHNILLRYSNEKLLN